MKKQIKSVSIFSVKGIITVAILSAVLCGFEASANNKPSAAISAVKIEVKSANEVESLMISDAELKLESVQYNADEYVKAELALEIEGVMSGSDEFNYDAAQYNANLFVEADMAVEEESWMNSNACSNDEVVQYKAEQYAEADLVLEIETWMNNGSY